MKRPALLSGRSTPTLAIGAGIAVLVLAGAAVAFMVSRGGDDSAEPASPTGTAAPSSTATATATAAATVEPSPTPIAHPGILDGVAMSDAEWDARKDLLPLAVMLDNTSSAYPHAGLDKADLVYEAFVEGGITRLMAVFWRQEAETVLPVRSARTPFLMWVSELGAMYGHAGGAVTENDANAIGQIYEWGIKDLNSFSPVSNLYYYRDHDRYEPYNLGTSTGYLREAAARLGYTGPPRVESWKFREPGTQLPAGKAAGGISIDFFVRAYPWQDIQWKWDAASRRYLRFQFGGPHLDAISQKQLSFATVVVMTAPSQVVDASGHVLYEQLGSGPATVFTGGQAYEGTWKKPDRESRTRFYDASGNEIVFERGPVFVELLNTTSSFLFFASSGELPELPKVELPPPGVLPFDDSDTEPAPTAEPSATPTAVPSPSPTAAASPTAVAGGTTEPPTPTETARVSPTPLVTVAPE